MKRTTIIGLALIFAALAAAALYVPAAEAQGFTTGRPGGRGGNWEFFMPLIYADSATINGQGGSSVDVNAAWGFGFGFGYNFSDQLQLNGLFNWNSRSYDATVITDTGAPRRYSNYMDTSTLSVNGVYYFLKGDITPFVSGGVGITYVDTNIQNGPATGSCWYDPWWGYVCSSYVPTKTENDISYNAGIGVRFDANRQFGLQVGYYKTWIDISKASGTPDFDIWRFDFIFRM
jgi:opacity protein-like surface antigen